MGDIRFREPYERVRDSPDPAAVVRALEDEDLVAALAAASGEQDPLLANVLATELQNRVRRTGAVSTHLGDGVLAADWEGRITYLNPEGERLLGMSRAEAVGRGVLDLLHPLHEDGRPYVDATHDLETMLGAGQPLRLVDVLLAPPGRAPFPADCTVTPILRDGDYAGFVLVFRDITDRKRAEAARLREVLEATLGGGLPRPGRAPEEEAESALATSGDPHPRKPWSFPEGPSAALAGALDYPLLDRLTLAFLWVSLLVLTLTLYTPIGGPVFGGANPPFDLPGAMGALGDARGVTFFAGLALALAGTAACRLLAPRSHAAWRFSGAVALSLFAPLFSITLGGTGEAREFLLLVAVWAALWADWRAPWLVVAVGAMAFGALTAATPAWLDTENFTVSRLFARVAPAAGAAAVASALSAAHHRSVRALESARNVLAADLAERRRAEEASRESEARYRSLFEASPDAVLVADTNRCILEANPAFARMTGYATEELEGKSTAILYDDETEYQELGEAFREQADTGEPFTRVVRWCRKAGDAFPAQLTGSSIRDEDGAANRYIVIARDLSAPTPIRVAAIREAEDALEQAVGASRVPMVVVDPEGRVRVWNRAAEETFGWTADEVLGHRLPIIPPGREEEFRRHLARMHRGVSLECHETLRRRKDGTLIPVRLTLTPLTDEQGKLRRVVAILEGMDDPTKGEA